MHQAVEAKEGVRIERENQTLATVTFQNYFRMYKKLSGMTGTADTEAAEFNKIYKLEGRGHSYEPPDGPPGARGHRLSDCGRENGATRRKTLRSASGSGSPCLSAPFRSRSPSCSPKRLKSMKVPHEVLNAKHHEREARIIAQAGRKGAVTVSTNMAGRGTDILLGGNPEFLARESMCRKGIDPDHPDNATTWQKTFERCKAETDAEHDEVAALGGLYVLGTERHESRRIDNQLRGRAGRQGDSGGSRFYLSLQDDLMRVFGGERMQSLMLKLGMEEDVPIESRLITKRIEAAQAAVEAQHFESRKHVLEYDDVMNKQREAVYGMRRRFSHGEDLRTHVLDMVGDVIGEFVEIRCPDRAHPDTYDLAGLRNDIASHFDVRCESVDTDGLDPQGIADAYTQEACNAYAAKAATADVERMRYTERVIMLQLLDQQWKDHLLSMDHLKEGIGLRGYGQKDPLVEYKKESFHIFQQMMDTLRDETLKVLFRLNVEPASQQATAEPSAAPQDEREPIVIDIGPPAQRRQDALDHYVRDAVRRNQRQIRQAHAVGGDEGGGTVTQVVRGKKVGRNEPCPCGSGRKYKRCHGAIK